MFESTEDVVRDAEREDKIGLEIGPELVSLLREGSPLRERMVALRQSIAREIGLPVPAIRIRDNANLSGGEYKILLLGQVVAGGELPGNDLVALNPDNRPNPPTGAEYLEPAFGLSGVLVKADDRQELEAAGFLILDSTMILTTHLERLIRGQAADLLGRAEAVRLLKGTRGKFPGLVNEFLKSYQAGELRAVLALMLEEGISIGYMPIVLEVFAEHARARGDAFAPEEIYAGIRARLKHVLCADVTEAGHMSVFSAHEEPGGDEMTGKALRMSMRACIEKAAGMDLFPIVLTPGAIRLKIFRALAVGIDPSLFKVLCRGDIPYGVEIDIIDRLSPGHAPGSNGSAPGSRAEGFLEGFAAGLKQGLNLRQYRGT